MMNALKRFHKDERGAEGVEIVLILAAVALPLLALLIAFRKKINAWVNEIWETTADEGSDAFDEPSDAL